MEERSDHWRVVLERASAAEHNGNFTYNGRSYTRITELIVARDFRRSETDTHLVQPIGRILPIHRCFQFSSR